MRWAVRPSSSFWRICSRNSSHMLREVAEEAVVSPSADPVGALVSFASADPVGTSPVGALVSFDGSRPRCRRTALRLISRVLAMRRSDIPWACKLLMACTLSMASRFAMSPLSVVVLGEKPHIGAAHAFLVQLVSFQAPIAGILSAPADSIRPRPVGLHRGLGRHGQGAPDPRRRPGGGRGVLLPGQRPRDDHRRPLDSHLDHRGLRHRQVHGLHAQQPHAVGADALGGHRDRRRDRGDGEHLPLHRGEEDTRPSRRPWRPPARSAWR